MGLAFELAGNMNKYLSVQAVLNRRFSLSILRLRVEKDMFQSILEQLLTESLASHASKQRAALLADCC